MMYVGCSTQSISFKWLNYSSRNQKFKNFFFAEIVTLARQQVFRNSTDINNLNNQYADMCDRLQLDLETLEILFQRLLGQSLTAQLVRNRRLSI